MMMEPHGKVLLHHFRGARIINGPRLSFGPWRESRLWTAYPAQSLKHHVSRYLVTTVKLHDSHRKTVELMS